MPGRTAEDVYYSRLAGQARTGSTADDRYRFISTETLEFLAVQGDQAAMTELASRQSQAGTPPNVVDIGGGFVGIQDPTTKQWTIREANVSGGGGSAPAYSSTRQAAQETMAFEREQTAASQKFQAEQERLDREFRERETRLSNLNNLIQQAMADQRSAKEMKFNLRNDSFALAGAFSAFGPRGVTPTQALGNELTNFANAPLPQVSQNATLPQINQATQQVQQLGAPPVGGGFGMAQGGSMGPQGPDFSPPGYSVIVGEGALNGDEEVVTRLNDGTVLVTPLKGGAATGATLPTAPSSYAAIEDLYRPFGFTNFPKYHVDPSRGGIAGGFSTRGTTPEQFSALGYQPTTVRNPTTGGVYFLDRASGSLRPFSTAGFNRLGFDYGNVMNATPGQWASLTQGLTPGSVVSTLPEIGPDTGSFGPSSVPLFTTFGQMLPNPFYIGAELQDAALNDPVAWQNYVSVYANAKGPAGQPMGIPPEQLLAMAKSPFPTGVPTGVLGLR